MGAFIMTESKKLFWHKDDTPIPKRGEILKNMFNESWKVVDKKAVSLGYSLILEKLPPNFDRTELLAKYGSRDETTLRLDMDMRDRIKVAAAMEQKATGSPCNMKQWIERRVDEAEKKYGMEG